MKQQIEQSKAIRRCLLKALYAVRRSEKKLEVFVWRRDLEAEAGCDIDFDLGYLIDRGLVQQDGPKYRITALGIDEIEQENS